MKTLGDHLRKRRLDLGLFQRHVGGRLGVTTDTVVNWEKNRTEPEVRFLPLIIEFLGYDPNPAPQTLGEKLIHCQRVLGLSRKRLAAELGVDESTLRDWERGLHRPTAKRTVSLLQNLFARAAVPDDVRQEDR
ncbi:transcriptional regulator [candidate division BRC1 bacterium HGW-BRC1-1]|nr:MAG: transcriptional regulator [candidate division BRC1 bacterium HGW-BRC1-1]